MAQHPPPSQPPFRRSAILIVIIPRQKQPSQAPDLPQLLRSRLSLWEQRDIPKEREGRGARWVWVWAVLNSLC